jgi:methyl-accepting chemotaxis protein
MPDPETTDAASKDSLTDQLHPILQEWSQLITSLANLIRENVEGLLPAVFGLANLAQRASEAKVSASQGARAAGASLRERATELRHSMQPLEHAIAEAKPLREQLGPLSEQAARLRGQYAGDAELIRFLDALDSDGGAIGRVSRLVAAAETVEAAGLGALSELEQGLDRVDQLLHADTAELEAAAARVKHFVDSSREAIDQLIVKLQFQDRTDQILQHLLTDFESLRSALDEVGEQPFDVDAWRAERQKRFTTAEERNAGSSQVSTDAGDIELF